MLRIGCHLSSAKGYVSMAEQAKVISANTFQFFTRNPRGGSAKNINPEDVSEFCKQPLSAASRAAFPGQSGPY